MIRQKVDALGVAWIAAFALSIVLANYFISNFEELHLPFGPWAMAAPAGVWFAALVLTFRDGVRERLGYRGALVAIVLGALLSLYLEAATSTAFNILNFEIGNWDPSAGPPPYGPDLAQAPDALWRVFGEYGQWDYFLNSGAEHFERGWQYGVLPVSAASAAAFLLSELLDAQVYERIRRMSRITAIAVSGTAGLVLDSALFVLLAFGTGGNAEGAAYVPLVAGLVVMKLLLTLAAVGVYGMVRDLRLRRRLVEVLSI